MTKYLPPLEDALGVLGFALLVVGVYLWVGLAPALVVAGLLLTAAAYGLGRSGRG